MIRRLMVFISVVYLARILGKEEFGFVNMAFALLAYGSVLSAAGLPMVGTKRIAQGDHQGIGEILGARILITLPMVAILTMGSFLCINDRTQSSGIAILSLALCAQIFFFDWYFQGREQFTIISIGRALSSCCYTLLILLFVHDRHDIWKFACAAVAGDSLAAFFYWLQFRREQPQHIRIRFSFRLFKESFLLSVGVILSTLVINYPPIILSAVQSNTEVGIYSAASKVVFIFLIGDRLLLPLLIPASARTFTGSPQALSPLLSEALRWILLLAFPAALGSIILAEPIITLIFGTAYVTSTAVFQVFIWFFFFTMLHSVYVSGLIAVGKENAYGKNMVLTTGCYAFTVTLGSVWFGAIGAAFGVVLSEAVSVVMMRHALGTILTIQTPKAIDRILYASFVMGSVAFCCRNLPLISTVLISILIYGAALFLFRAITWNEAKAFLLRFI